MRPDNHFERIACAKIAGNVDAELEKIPPALARLRSNVKINSYHTPHARAKRQQGHLRFAIGGAGFDPIDGIAPQNVCEDVIHAFIIKNFVSYRPSARAQLLQRPQAVAYAAMENKHRSRHDSSHWHPLEQVERCLEDGAGAT
jgi:hypothetical protein